MNNPQKKVKKIVQKLASQMIDRDTYEWPPQCSFITYQPKRPLHVRSNTTLITKGK